MTATGPPSEKFIVDIRFEFTYQVEFSGQKCRSHGTRIDSD